MEKFDPFNSNTLSDQDFVLTFDMIMWRAFSMRCNVLIIKNSKLLIDKMKNEIKQGFDPSLRDIKARYVALGRQFNKSG